MAIFGVLFAKNFEPGVAHFANDGPIGTLLARPYQTPDSYRGIWNDLLWLGAWNGNFNPNITGLAIGAIGPTYYHKFMIPIGLIFLGLSAAYCGQRFGFPRWVCILVGTAAALNMNVFSNACWGLPSRAHAMGAAFLALAAMRASAGRFAVIKAVLAGLAIGLGITEGGDNGAIFAIVVGCYGFFHVVTEGNVSSRVGGSGWLNRALRGAGLVAVSAIVAAVFAAQTLNIFVNTAVKGVVGMSDDSLTPEQKWDFATQGSLHPTETLRVIIPGLFGYRMDAEDGGNYWGRVGESVFAEGTSRHSGAGEYAGVIVVLIALWAVHHSLRSQGGFSMSERRHIWFWALTAFVCLLLAWGKWGLLYRVLYSLPYFNTIRLPLKWMHPFHLSLLLLFGYGLVGLGRMYLERVQRSNSGVTGESSRSWWSEAVTHERTWIWFCLGLAGISILGAFAYAASKESLTQFMVKAKVIGDPAKMAAFSIHEVHLYVMFLLLSGGALVAIFSGRLVGRTGLVALVIGLLFTVDLVRANRHWMLFFNYQERYALNPPLEFLKEHTVNYRVAKVPVRPVMQSLQSVAMANRNNPQILQQLQAHAEIFQQGLGYTHEQWQQNQFPYYNIPCLDMSQEPRMPADKEAFNKAMIAATSHGHAMREYELTSTRYFVGCSDDAERLNAILDPVNRRFQERLRYRLVPTRAGSPFFGDLRVNADTNGPYAIIEFTGALPRARLFSKWETITNDVDTLARLGSSDFDPAQTLLVNEPFQPASTNLATGTNASPGEASIIPVHTSHRVVVEANAAVPSLLLLTDRFDPAWKVTVDREPAVLLRCNYLMRGVAVSAGRHTIEFSYHPGTGGFRLMVGCVVIGFILCGFLSIVGRKNGGRNEG